MNLKSIFKSLAVAVLLASCAAVMSAQSLDPATPAPIRTSNLLGRIAARDLGDSRLTHHYYAFTGTPGDLLITIQSSNLNGDIDVFTAVTMRPLLKLSLYAENTRPITKGIYLRKRESLILRIEARSPNDEEGTYQLFFSGSFEPIVGGPDVGESEPAETNSTSSDRKTKRVTSVGARINEPEPPVTEVAATPTPAPTPEAKAEEVKPKEPKVTTSRTPRNRTRTPTPIRRSTTPAPKPKPAEVEKTEESVAKTETPEPKAKPPARTNNRRVATPVKPAPKPAPEPEPETGPRLIIETNDGTLINRSMSGVRRVTVENGQVVVTGKDGKIDRILLANVVRMSIAP